MNTEPGMMKNVEMSVVMHTYTPSTVEVEVGRSQSHSCPLLCGETLFKKETRACV